MKKVKRLKEGGFTKEQEEWLGGADRTDPYILARMRKAVPDAPKSEKKAEPKAEPKAETEIKTETKQGKNPNIDAATREQALYENAPRFIAKGYSSRSINPDRLVRKDILNELNNKFDAVAYNINPEYKDAGYKKGGKVSSASKRADGCAVRGKTRA
jgi:hypothetical protein